MLARSISIIICLLLLALSAKAQDNPLDRLFNSFGGSQPTAQTSTRQVPESRGEIQFSFAPLVRQSAPSVVNIYTTRAVRRRSPFADTPFFEEFFGNRFGGSERLQSSLGSGVVVDENGLIVTNYHVIEGAHEVRVVLSDGREYQSSVILRDERTDLAVLRLDSREQFEPLAFADSDTVLTGDLVLAIGNPFGVG